MAIVHHKKQKSIEKRILANKGIINVCVLLGNQLQLDLESNMSCKQKKLFNKWIFGLKVIALSASACFLCFLVSNKRSFNGVKPIENIVFLYTTETGSSKIQNIFFRYGIKHNLLFALPKENSYFGADYGSFLRILNVIPRPRLQLVNGAITRRDYNLLVHPTRYERFVLRILMPPNSIYVTILRHPVDVFESAYYSKHQEMDEFYLNLETYVNYAEKYNNSWNNMTELRKFKRNQLLFDFGLDTTNSENLILIEKKLKEIDGDFKLVMIAEYFDESLVLLRDILHWGTDDIVTLDVIAQRRQHIALSNSTRAKIALWNSGDMLFYNHFKSNFLTRLQDYGMEKMNQEVKYLRQRRKELNDYCQIRSISKSEENIGTFKAFHLDAQSFLPSGIRMQDPLCLHLTLPERHFTETLREKQLEMTEFEEILKTLK